jgi:error-prone DNA polymerase
VYAELHCHSAFSFLDGASLPEDLVATALELGYDSLALTDHNSVSGSMEFAKAAQSLSLPKPLHGAEIDLDDGRHLTLIVENQRGWSNLCRLLTLAYTDTRARPGSQASPPQVRLNDVIAHNEGLIALSGCHAHGVQDEATLRALRDAFTPARLKIELQRPYLRDDRARNRRLAQLAARLELATVATGDVHAHNRERALLQDALVAIRLHSTLDATEAERRGNFSHVLASPAAMAARFAEYPEAVAESARIAERVDFDLTVDLGYRYPGTEDPTKLHQLAELCHATLYERYADASEQVRSEALARLNEELRLIEHLNLAGFFMLHHEMLELAREVAVEVRGSSPRSWLPPGRGRGSSVSSIVCYLTGLSHVDPIAAKLAIGRFLSEDLHALPDIDLDFPRDIRAALIPRVHEHFGRERSALVAAFPTYRAHGAIRELGKALGLPAGEIERLARGSEGWDARAVEADIAATFGAGRDAGAEIEPRTGAGSGGGTGPGGGPGPRTVGGPLATDHRYSTGRWRWLAFLAAQIHGLPRHLSQHSGGMVVATRPLIDCCPIVPTAMAERQIVQWDKDSCADAGFLKIDLLGLGMLSAVERCVELIAHTRGERIDLSRIPPQDPEVYAAIQRADTTGVFQIESRAQMQSLTRTRPKNLQELAIQVAIVRPGPIQGGSVNLYIQHRQRQRLDPGYRVTYEHPSLEPALRETLGAIIFQDQVLEVAIAFAGFKPGEAENLRRAMSRKRSQEAIEAHHERFVKGAMDRHGVSLEVAERVFQKVRGFAGFGFPKAHAAAFALLAYQSTWLRVNYGPEFLCALLNEQPMGFYPPDALVHEAGRRGIEVLAPDVNRSGVDCELDGDGSVRIGLGYVRGVSAEGARALVAARERGGPFRSLTDLASRVGAGSAALQLLAWAGACDSLVAGGAVAGERLASGQPAGDRLAGHRPAGSSRRQVLWELGIAAPGRRVPGGVQLSLPLALPQAPTLKALSEWDRTLADYDSTGLTVGRHPLAQLRSRLPPGCVDSAQLPHIRHGTSVQVAGLVIARQRPGTASGMVFVLLEDEHGTINLVLPAAVYERHRLLVRTEPLLLAEGKLERPAAGNGTISVLVRRVAVTPIPGQELAQILELPAANAAAGALEEDRDGERRNATAGGAESQTEQLADARMQMRAVAHSWR